MNFYKLYELVKNTSLPRVKLQWEYSNDTFKSWLMSEITRELARDLNKWHKDNTEELPFNDLFTKEKFVSRQEIDDRLTAEQYPVTRRVVNFTLAPEAVSILDKIKQKGLNIDFENGMIEDGKRKTRLGKFVLDKKSPFSENEKKWWVGSGNPIPELEATKNKDDYTIVVSRNPIDIVRMSDHDGWTSCHAPSREYFQCAVSDAKGAGAIAYVVKKEDLNKINLQDSEIFGDRRRGIPGINPISRLRLRKFVHKEDGYDLAVPENRMYGKQFPGLVESMREWTLQSQLPKLAKYGTIEDWKNSLSGIERPRMKDFQLMGGSYQDTQGGTLFNHLFGDDLDHGDADYGGEDENQNMVDQMEEEVNLIEREYRNSFKICSFYATVEEGEGHPYVHYSGTVGLSVPDELMVNPGPRTIGDTEEPDYWKKTKAITEAIRRWARDNDIYGINDIDISGGDVRIDIYDDDGNNDPDSLRSFLDHDLSDIDKKADELNAGLYNLFVQLGLATQNKVNYISNNWDEHPHQFQNFEWEGEEPAVMVSIRKPISLPAPPNSTAGYQHEYKYWQEQFKKSLMAELTAWADKIFATRQSQRGLFQDPEFKYTPKPPFSKEFKIAPEITLAPQASGTDPGVLQNLEMKMSIAFEPFSKDEDVNDAIDFISFLDKNYQKFTTLVDNIYYKWVGNWGKSQPQA